jgi:hypothetical protein
VVPGTFGTALDEVNGGSCGRVGTLLLYANFGEIPKGEVRRIPIPRTSVNKGKRVQSWGLLFSLSVLPPHVTLPTIIDKQNVGNVNQRRSANQ